MNEIKINSTSIEREIESLQNEMKRLQHMGEVAVNIPEINEMKPDVSFDKVEGDKLWCGGWTVTLQFDKCYARIYDSCRIRFVHFDDTYFNGRKEELSVYHDEETLTKAFKNHIEFLK